MNLPSLPARKPDSHKGDYGHALLVGGSQRMPGSVALAGLAALRSGAGLVTVATTHECWPVVASFEPSYMTVPLPSQAGCLGTEALAQLRTLVTHTDCLGLGPGLGQTDEVRKLVTELFPWLETPMVVDADALNAIAASREGLRASVAPRILTPHPGEFRRLAKDDALTLAHMPILAKALAKEHRLIIVLKGHRTLVTDGHREYTNETGNAGMATGGSGDVLTGIITALVSQGLEPFEAACLGSHLHGAAGDLAATHHGETGLIARDLCDWLPRAFMNYQPHQGD